jgi:hypothetical protein
MRLLPPSSRIGFAMLWFLPLIRVLNAVKATRGKPLSVRVQLAPVIPCGIAAGLASWLIATEMDGRSSPVALGLLLFLCHLGVASVALTVLVPLVKTGYLPEQGRP